jgi:hypothetical protein
MRKVLRVLAAAAAGLTLLSCNRPPKPQEAVYAPPLPAKYGNATYAQSAVTPEGARLVWKASPRWATVKREANTGVVKQDQQAKFKDAQAKAAEVGVENLTKEDIEGLTLAEVKQLRGY